MIKKIFDSDDDSDSDSDIYDDNDSDDENFVSYIECKCGMKTSVNCAGSCNFGCGFCGKIDCAACASKCLRCKMVCCSDCTKCSRCKTLRCDRCIAYIEKTQECLCLKCLKEYKKEK